MASQEVSLVSMYAAVYNYDQTTNDWLSVDGGSSRVFIFHNKTTGAYRIIGITTSDEQYILNTPIFKGLLHQRLSDLFLQWRDTSKIYGLSFAAVPDADQFIQVLDDCIKKLTDQQARAPAPVPRPRPQTMSGTNSAVAGAVATAASVNRPPPVVSRSSSSSGTQNAASATAAPAPVDRPAPSIAPRPRVGTGTPPVSHAVAAVSAVQPAATPPAIAPRAPSAAAMSNEPTIDVTKEPASGLNSRNKVIKEIYTTEFDYVENLKKLVQQCVNPVTEGKFKNLFTEDDKRTIFKNIVIIQNINMKFLEQLRERLIAWNDLSMIGDIFKSTVPLFKLYSEYYQNYEEGSDLLEKLSKKKDVANYLKHCESVTDGHKLQFLLVMPVQRLPRYVLLLAELIKHTPTDHLDLDNLTKSLELLKSSTTNMNERIRENENRRTYNEIAENPKKYVGFEKILADRYLLFESNVTIKMADKVYTWMLLFNDLIVFSSTTSVKPLRRQFEDKFALEYVWFEDLSMMGKDMVIRLVTPTSMVLVETPSTTDKANWLDTLDRAIIKILELKRMAFQGLVRTFGFTLPSGDHYEGEWVYGEPCGQGVYTYANGNVYTGQFKAGKIEGTGKMAYKIGSVYEGHWKDGKPDGDGRLDYLGASYTGTWIVGQRNGQGVMNWSNGDSYDGEWRCDRMCGKGTYVFDSGTSYYVGNFQDDSFHGEGKLTNKMGVYEGSWEADRKNGQGTMTYANGDVYRGYWKDNERDGHGVFESADGYARFEGEWRQGLYNGKGELRHNSQIVYVGEWRDGRRAGKGIQNYPDGSKYDGQWEKDRRVGQGVLTARDGSVYDGGWFNDMKAGKGRFTSANGAVYDGEWISDQRQGSGVANWPDGSCYSGSWSMDLRSGKGIYTNSNKTIKCTATWEADQMCGKCTISDPLGVFEGEFVDDKRNGPGRFVTKDGVTYEGNWRNNVMDGEIKVTMRDGTIATQYWREGRIEGSGATNPPQINFGKVFKLTFC